MMSYEDIIENLTEQINVLTAENSLLRAQNEQIRQTHYSREAVEAMMKERVEVVRGEWLNFVGDYVTAECSACGECYDPSDHNDKEHFDIFKQLYKFCPSCGARMDGEKEGV